MKTAGIRIKGVGQNIIATEKEIKVKYGENRIYRQNYYAGGIFWIVTISAFFIGIIINELINDDEARLKENELLKQSLTYCNESLQKIEAIKQEQSTQSDETAMGIFSSLFNDIKDINFDLKYKDGSQVSCKIIGRK